MKSHEFICENCRNRVSPSAKLCPHCGRFFSDVKCPRCNYTGEARQFMLGCPNCGYGGPASTGPQEALKMETYDLEEVSGAGRVGRQDGHRPQWLGLLAIVVTAVVFALMVVVYLLTSP